MNKEQKGSYLEPYFSNKSSLLHWLHTDCPKILCWISAEKVKQDDVIYTPIPMYLYMQ